MNLIEQFEQLQAPGPLPTAISRPFWQAAAQHQFMLQHCRHCHQWVFYPRGHCPHCWGGELEWKPASGLGCLRSFSLVHRPGHAAWKVLAPYALGIIELAEGPTMLSTLPSAQPELLQVGMPVAVQFVQIGQFTLPMFVPAQHQESQL